MILKGRLIATQAYLKRKEKSQINNQILDVKELDPGEPKKKKKAQISNEGKSEWK